MILYFLWVRNVGMASWSYIKFQSRYWQPRIFSLFWICVRGSALCGCQHSVLGWLLAEAALSISNMATYSILQTEKSIDISKT